MEIQEMIHIEIVRIATSIRNIVCLVIPIESSCDRRFLLWLFLAQVAFIDFARPNVKWWFGMDRFLYLEARLGAARGPACT